MLACITVNADVLCASDYGVPQDRRRAFVIGRRGAGDPVEMPRKHEERTTIWDAISDLNYLNSDLKRIIFNDYYEGII